MSIMKEQWSISKDKLVALEDGTSCNEEQECAKSAGRSNACTQAIQTVKFILYLELLVIVAWACYSIWKPYHVQSMEVKVTDILREPESPNVILLEEQPTQETSTIAARPVYGSEDSLKRQDAVDDLPKFVPDDLKEIFNSENTESSLGWPVSFDYSNFGDAMNFRFVAPSLSSMEVDEREKEPGSSESAQRLIDNKSEQSQQSKEYEKSLLGNYMLLSLLVQNAARISEAMKDSKEIVDPKFEFKLENSGPLELEDSSRLELDNSGPLPWFSSVRLESEEEIDSDLEDSEEESSSTQIYDNYESGTLNILNNTHETVPEDGTEPEQQETSIKSNEQMPQSMDSGEKEGKHEEEQSSLEKSAIRNAEAVEDSSEEVDPNSSSGLLETEDSGPLELEDSSRLELDNSGPLPWFSSVRLESEEEIDSDLEDSEEESSSTQIYDNYESGTLNILNNTHETVPEDGTEPEQQETSIKSNEQMPQSMDSGEKEGKHEEEQSSLEKSAMRNAEASEDSNEEVDQNSNSGLLETQDSGPSEFEYWGSIEWDRLNRYRSRVSPLLDWEYSDLLEQQKEFGSDLEDSQDKPSSTQTDDNYESTTLNILNNTHETVPEDSTEPEQEETSIKSNEQMPQSMDSGWTPDWVYQSASEERKHEEEQATETTASDETEAETEDDEIPLFSFDFSDSVENTHSLLHSDAGESEESESHSFVWGTFYKIAKQAQTACSEIIYPGVVIHHEDANYSYERDAQARCDKHKKTFCEYLNRTLKLTDCSNFSILRSKVVP